MLCVMDREERLGWLGMHCSGPTGLWFRLFHSLQRLCPHYWYNYYEWGSPRMHSHVNSRGDITVKWLFHAMCLSSGGVWRDQNKQHQLHFQQCNIFESIGVNVQVLIVFWMNIVDDSKGKMLELDASPELLPWHRTVCRVLTKTHKLEDNCETIHYMPDTIVITLEIPMHVQYNIKHTCKYIVLWHSFSKVR